MDKRRAKRIASGRDRQWASRQIKRALADALPITEVADILKCTRQNIARVAPGRRHTSKGPLPPPRYTLPTSRDLRHARDLMDLGVVTGEALELVGYPHLATSVTGVYRFKLGHPARVGSWVADYTWRAWKGLVLQQMKILIATSALKNGATMREASAVSGLPMGSMSFYIDRDEMPRSVYKQGEAGKRGERKDGGGRDESGGRGRTGDGHE